MVPNAQFLHIDVAAAGSSGMSLGSYAFDPGTYAHWRSAFGAAHYASSNYVTSHFQGFVGLDDTPVSTTTSAVRLYRANPVATIDAVLKTVRVYPTNDVYVAFSALDADGNRFVEQASQNQLRLRVTVGDTSVESSACTVDQFASVGYCYVPSANLATLYTTAPQSMSARIYSASTTVESSTLAGLLAPVVQARQGDCKPV